MLRRAVFLDRDGVINELALNRATGEYESPHSLDDTRVLPGAIDAARCLQEAGFLLFVVSNQPSYAKGKVSLEVIQAVAAKVEQALRDGGVRLAEAYYCYHHPQGLVPGFSGPCGCRKPGTQSLLQARDHYHLDLAQSWMIGDQESDIECGRRAGCRTIMIANPLSAHRRPGVEKPTLTAADLPDAVAKLLAVVSPLPLREGGRGRGDCPMNCLVLAAGLSTRLAKLTGGAPKPLTPVAGVPVLHRNLLWLARQGIRDAYINLHYRAEEIRASVGDGSAFGVKVRWSEENPLLGTAGGAKKLERELTADGGPFLIVYGDSVYDFDFQRMIAEHAARRGLTPISGRGLTPISGSLEIGCLSPQLLGTIAVFDTEKNLHTGIAGGRVASSADGRITSFVERDPDAPGHVNAACYVLEPAVLQHVPAPPQASDWARDVFPKMLAAGLHLRSHLIDGYCLGIDTPESYRRAEEILRSHQPGR